MQQTETLHTYDDNIRSIYTATRDAFQHPPLTCSAHTLRHQHHEMTKLYKRIYRLQDTDPVVSRTINHLKKAIWNLRDSYSSALNNDWGKSDFQQAIARQALQRVSIALKNSQART